MYLSERACGDPSQAQTPSCGSFLRAFGWCPSCTECKALRGRPSVAAPITEKHACTCTCAVTLPPTLFPALSSLFIFQNPVFILPPLWNLGNTLRRIDHSSFAPLCTYFGRCNVYYVLHGVLSAYVCLRYWAPLGRRPWLINLHSPSIAPR